MQKHTKFSLWYTVAVVGAMLALNTLLFSGSAVPQIAYSEFLARVTADQVERVVITQDTIYGIDKAPTRPPQPAPTPVDDRAAGDRQTPWRVLARPALAAAHGRPRAVAREAEARRTRRAEAPASRSFRCPTRSSSQTPPAARRRLPRRGRHRTGRATSSQLDPARSASCSSSGDTLMRRMGRRRPRRAEHRAEQGEDLRRPIRPRA